MEQAAFDRAVPAMPALGLPGISIPRIFRSKRLDNESPLAGGPPLAMVQAILEHVHFGVAVIGAQLRLLFANQAARRECSRHPLLRTERGHLVLVQPRHDEEFRRALAAARCGRWSLVQLKAAGDDTMMLAVVPLPARVTAGEDVPVLVVFGLRSHCKALAIPFYAQSCGMTMAEERVLRSLSEGLSPREIAHQHEVALSTVRTQLGSIRNKAGAGSLTDLMRTLGCLPPIMPAALYST